MPAIISSRDANDLTRAVVAAETYGVLVGAFNAALIAAINLGNTSCTLSVAAKTTGDTQRLIKELEDLGYNATVSTTTMTIKWDGSFVASTISY